MILVLKVHYYHTRINMIKTEYEFILPRGYVDNDGNIHRKGIMRLATAADEILPLKDPRVQQNPAYLTVIILSRVITKLGELPDINTNVIEKLYTADIDFVSNFYQAINNSEYGCVNVTCPKCGEKIQVPLNKIFED